MKHGFIYILPASRDSDLPLIISANPPRILHNISRAGGDGSSLVRLVFVVQGYINANKLMYKNDRQAGGKFVVPLLLGKGSLIHVLRHPMKSLSAKLLLLTILFVMLAEILIFVPSVANYRKTWLKENLANSQFIPLAAMAAPDGKLPADLKKKLLEKAAVYSIQVKTRKEKLSLRIEQPGPVDYATDIDKASAFQLILDALYVFIVPHDRIIKVRGKAGMMDDERMEIVISEAPLKKALYTYATNIFLLSLVISIISATLIFFAINRILVQPMTKLASDIENFAADPEDHSRIIQPGNRQDEVGVAEKNLADMQIELNTMLKQKKRLADLGLAVSKINHDLRNMLANAQLISDNLGTIENPAVQRLTPRLITSLDRAIRLCADTLKYGKSPRAQLEPRRFPLLPLAEEVLESSGATGVAGPQEIILQTSIPQGLELTADRDQMFRVLSNLVRNAIQAIKSAPSLKDEKNDHQDIINIEGYAKDDEIHICVSDTGPGIPQHLHANLFKPFQNSGHKNGTGLGLAISAEIIVAHGGKIDIESTLSTGSRFHIILPGKTVRKIESQITPS